MIPGKWDLAVRYSVVDYNQGAPHDETNVVTAATDWYFKKNNVKLQFDYSQTHRQRPAGLSGQRPALPLPAPADALIARKLRALA